MYCGTGEKKKQSYVAADLQNKGRNLDIFVTW